jgi:hypothetical protein
MNDDIVGGWWTCRPGLEGSNSNRVYERAGITSDNFQTSNAVTITLFDASIMSVSMGIKRKYPAINVAIGLPVDRYDLQSRLAFELRRTIDEFMVNNQISPEFRKLSDL